MSKRNFILLIIILGLAIIAVFGFLYSRKGATTGSDNNSTGINFISQFNPFGSKTPAKDSTSPENDTANSQPDSSTQGKVPTGKLIKVSSMPVAGFTLFMKERLKEIPVPAPTPQTSGDTKAPAQTPAEPAKANTKPVPPPTEFALAIRYVERATGNIYQTFADKIEERKFSDTIIPKVYDAYFGKNGESVVMRHLKGNDTIIETFMATLPKEKLGEDVDNNTLKGTLLVNDIKDISLSPDASKIFQLFDVGESMVGTTLNLPDGKKSQIFESPFTEWLSFWPTSKTITLTTKASGEALGYMYVLDVDKKNLTKVLGDINGLTTQMSPDGKSVLYGNNNLSLSVYHTDTKTSETVGVRTLPEKCIWNKASDSVYCAVPESAGAATYPDDWYKGKVSFSDQIWKINIKDGTTSLLADLPSMVTEENIDGIKLAVDADENYLFFINKRDSSLWELSLK